MYKVVDINSKHFPSLYNYVKKFKKAPKHT